MTRFKTKKLRAFGVDTTQAELAMIAVENGISSDQTVRNWIVRYGDTETGIEKMLRDKFKIYNAVQLKLIIDGKSIDEEYADRNEEGIKNMGFPPFEKKEEELPKIDPTPAIDYILWNTIDVDTNEEAPAEELIVKSDRIGILDAIIDWKLDYLLGNVVESCARAATGTHMQKLEQLGRAREFINKAINVELREEQ